MTREEFKEILDEKEYPYEMEGDKIIITHEGSVDLEELKSIPEEVKFENGRHIYLESLESISPGVSFDHDGDVKLDFLTGEWFEDWEGNIKGIKSNRLLNKMVELGLFDRR